MPQPEFVEHIRSLILSYGGRDHAAFQRNAESIIRELNVKNRPGEAKLLRDALLKALEKKNSHGSTDSLTMLSKQVMGLVSIVSRSAHERLFFPPATETALRRVVDEYRASSLLAEAGLYSKTRLLFWGPPGCGKTAAAQWLASELSLQCNVVRLGSLITSFVGETGSNLQKVLVTTEQTPMVLLLDEADAIAKARDDANDVGELRRVVNSLLQGLDSVARRKSLIILASNHSHLFDPAIWRRFDDIIEFPLPTQKERIELLKYLTNGLKIVGSISNAAKNLSGFSFAQIERAVMDTAKTKVIYSKDSIAFTDIIAEARSWQLRMRRATDSKNGKT